MLMLDISSVMFSAPLMPVEVVSRTPQSYSRLLSSVTIDIV